MRLRFRAAPHLLHLGSLGPGVVGQLAALHLHDPSRVIGCSVLLLRRRGRGRALRGFMRRVRALGVRPTLVGKCGLLATAEGKAPKCWPAAALESLA